MSELDIHAYARGLYGRVNEMWGKHREDLFGGACGFDVLSGPPAYRPAVMIIGANPGFGAHDHRPSEDTTWPVTSYISEAQWPLAIKIRSIFAEAGRSDALDTAIQTNFLFFKSSSINAGPGSRYPWSDVAPMVRMKLERWSAEEIKDLIRVLEPALIIVLGTATFNAHAHHRRTVLRDRTGKRDLLLEGIIAERPAIGILHPTGARVANADWSRVSTELAERLTS
ncbi:hypothetical protein HZF05_16310 [Sphingomonas sp. CGMCC 1.13654]|uniref:Uracil-DNA glycosylase-like domain-containing protein n=1 Tax=Sphingomonas chungangi TaxID=2683589 RepID=A0A838LDS7_9SPHN|nr:hypothetical protein [Sphingomonas chungangi]MBA2935648.1 hypothetical protein [Sphingomonas chungangi]MVW54339.1 hypothetical protein [Sphingomonas chungangi]